MTFRMTIQGIQEAQAANNRLIAYLQPSSRMGALVKNVLTQAHRIAVMITHVDTGALRSSHRMRLDGIHGEIYIDPTSRNPDSAAKPYMYGVVEHARGGTHRFYERVVTEFMPQLEGVAEQSARGLFYG